MASPFASRYLAKEYESKLVETLQTPNNMDYARFNVLLAHLFLALSKSHSMSMFHVSSGRWTSVRIIVTSTFPAIKATNNKPTPAVTSKTVGYIHALLIDSLTFHSTDPVYARAIANAVLIGEELDKLTQETFRAELSACLLDYYEKVCCMAGVSGDKPVLKRKFGANTAAAAVAAQNNTEGALHHNMRRRMLALSRTSMPLFSKIMTFFC